VCPIVAFHFHSDTAKSRAITQNLDLHNNIVSCLPTANHTILLITSWQCVHPFNYVAVTYYRHLASRPLLLLCSSPISTTKTSLAFLVVQTTAGMLVVSVILDSGQKDASIYAVIAIYTHQSMLVLNEITEARTLACLCATIADKRRLLIRLRQESCGCCGCGCGGGVFSEIISVFIISPTIPARLRDIHTRLAAGRCVSQCLLHARSD